MDMAGMSVFSKQAYTQPLIAYDGGQHSMHVSIHVTSPIIGHHMEDAGTATARRNHHWVCGLQAGGCCWQVLCQG